MKRLVSIGVMTAFAIAALVPAAPAWAWDSGIADGSQPVISGDNFTMCAVRESAMIYCWGANASGQLGRGDVNPSLAVAPVTSPLTSLARSVSVNNATVCALMLNRTVKCWGANNQGMVGNGTTSAAVSTPTTVPGLTNVAAVTVGLNATCAVRQDGTVWCWGNPQWPGFTGFPSTQQDSPVKVAGITTATDVSLGGLHACVRRVDKRVVCWGANDSGQLGDGTTSPRTGLVTVAGISDASAVVVGYNDSCALRAGGTVSCWGDNSYGALGAATSATHSATPVPVFGVAGATSLAMSPYGGCVTIAGLVKCWGTDDLGRLGDGQYVTQAAPVRATASLAKATSVWSSYWGSCEIADGGRVWCWGNGSGGRLGDGTSNNAPDGTGPGNAFGIAANPYRVVLVNSAPGRPTGSSTAARRITISWTAPSTAGGISAPRDYAIYYQVKGSTVWRRFADPVTTSRRATVTPLTSGKYYRFKVVPLNWAGAGTASAISGYIKSR
ncbi:MAG: hypothetical protein GC157_16460 [Frankiales bacterium]|nr:hypothetical protein [Frankiales bacterium]